MDGGSKRLCPQPRVVLLRIVARMLDDLPRIVKVLRVPRFAQEYRAADLPHARERQDILSKREFLSRHP